MGGWKLQSGRQAQGCIVQHREYRHPFQIKNKKEINGTATPSNVLFSGKYQIQEEIPAPKSVLSNPETLNKAGWVR